MLRSSYRRAVRKRFAQRVFDPGDVDGEQGPGQFALAAGQRRGDGGVFVQGASDNAFIPCTRTTPIPPERLGPRMSAIYQGAYAGAV